MKDDCEERYLIDSIKILVELKIINSPDYWIKNARKGRQVDGEFAANLIKKVAYRLSFK